MTTLNFIMFFIYIASAYFTYYHSQKYKSNPYIWTAVGLLVPYAGAIICYLVHRKKKVVDKRPNLFPLGFRRRKPLNMVIALIVYLLFFSTAYAIFSGGSTYSLPQKQDDIKASSTIKSEADSKNTDKTDIEKTQTGKTSLDTVKPESVNRNKTNGNIKISYINVGQADSILIQQNGKNMLIDAGNNGDAQTIVNYLRQQNVSKLDYFIMTHPHEDHIGSADTIIKTFDTAKVYMPEVTTNTKTFSDVISTIKSKGLKITKPVSGSSFKLGDANCMILSPNRSKYDDLNNYSIVIKIVYGSNKFIFEGDAEKISEDEILARGFDISADVIKIGHHGSDSSSSREYISKVKPKYAVISVGKDNDYGHPSASVMERLRAMGIKVYRTDENGTIVCMSDGKNITFNCSPGSYAAASKGGVSGSGGQTSKAKPVPQSSTGQDDRIVYYTPGGHSYHYDRNCSTLKRSKTVKSGKLKDVIKLGKSDPCNICVK